MNSSSRPFRLFVPLFLAVAALILYSPNVAAQIGATSSIAGQVVDQSGGVIVGATITLTDTSTNAVRTQDTNDTGRYIFTNVLPGFYNLSVTKVGFQTTRLQKQEVLVGTPLTLGLMSSTSPWHFPRPTVIQKSRPVSMRPRNCAGFRPWLPNTSPGV